MTTPLIPKGYGLVAKTEMVGTGGTIVRAFYHPTDHKILFTVTYIDRDEDTHIVMMGPLEKRHLNPLIQTMRDVAEMAVPLFIGE